MRNRTPGSSLQDQWNSPNQTRNIINRQEVSIAEDGDGMAVPIAFFDFSPHCQKTSSTPIGHVEIFSSGIPSLSTSLLHQFRNKVDDVWPSGKHRQKFSSIPRTQTWPFGDQNRGSSQPWAFEGTSRHHADETRWDGPVNMNQIALILQNRIQGEEKTGDVVDDHPKIRNLLMFDQEFISGQKRKPVDFYTILILKIRAIAINLRCYNGDSIPLVLQESGHFFDEDTSIG